MEQLIQVSGRIASVMAMGISYGLMAQDTKATGEMIRLMVMEN
jgi:hypothetical protein